MRRTSLLATLLCVVAVGLMAHACLGDDDGEGGGGPYSSEPNDGPGEGPGDDPGDDGDGWESTYACESGASVLYECCAMAGGNCLAINTNYQCCLNKDCEPGQIVACMAYKNLWTVDECNLAIESCATGVPGACENMGVGCEDECDPDCSGRECGGDGCGGSCGSCYGGKTCDDGQCSSGCECDTYGDEECDGNSTLLWCDGCNWESHSCDTLCRNSGFAHADYCGYSSDSGKDTCFCEHHSGWGGGCFPDISACGWDTDDCVGSGSNWFCSKKCSDDDDCQNVAPGTEACFEVGTGAKWCFIMCDTPSDCLQYTSCVEGLCK